MTIGHFTSGITKPGLIVSFYLIQVVAIYLVDLASPGLAPTWTLMLVERKTELLALLIANLTLTSILLSLDTSDRLDAVKMAVGLGAVVGYGVVLESLTNPNVLEALVVATALLPTLMAIGVKVPFFWNVALGLAASFPVGFVGGILASIIVGEDDLIVSLAVLASMLGTFLGVSYLLTRRRDAPGDGG